MKPSEDIKPISFVKAHAAELLQELSQRPRTLVITQKGEAKAILQDVQSYERTQESLQMLKLIALGNAESEEGLAVPVEEGFADLKRRIEARRS